MSPEILNKQPYDMSCDLWALGCVLYEICELERPFEGATNEEVQDKILNTEPARINKRYSKGLWFIVRNLLQKDPENRIILTDILHLEIITENAKKYFSVEIIRAEFLLYAPFSAS